MNLDALNVTDLAGSSSKSESPSAPKCTAPTVTVPVGPMKLPTPYCQEKLKSAARPIRFSPETGAVTLEFNLTDEERYFTLASSRAALSAMPLRRWNGQPVQESRAATDSWSSAKARVVSSSDPAAIIPLQPRSHPSLERLRLLAK
jgi:hypothetical protein